MHKKTAKKRVKSKTTVQAESLQKAKGGSKRPASPAQTQQGAQQEKSFREKCDKEKHVKMSQVKSAAHEKISKAKRRTAGVKKKAKKKAKRAKQHVLKNLENLHKK